jgi:APA family basic amino acid/polyamine antiporter
MNFVAPAGILFWLGLMIYLGAWTWVRFGVWLALGLAIYFLYGRRHSVLGKALREEISRHGVSPAGSPLDGPDAPRESGGVEE